MTALPPTTTTDASTRVVALESQYPSGLLGVPASGIRLTWRVVSDDPDRAAARIPARERCRGLPSSRRKSRSWAPTRSASRHPATLRPARATQLTPSASRPPPAGPSGASRSPSRRGSTDADLEARVIGIPSEIDGPVPLLRREFTLSAAPSHGTAAPERAGSRRCLDQRRPRLRRAAHARVDLVPGADPDRHRRRHGVCCARARTSSCSPSARAGIAAASASRAARRSTATASARSRSSRSTARWRSSPTSPGRADSARSSRRASTTAP